VLYAANTVTVLLQAMKQEPAPDAKCKDKFLVQSVIIEEEANHDAITVVVRLIIFATSHASVSANQTFRGIV
jgi:hypothetical protein